MYTIFVNTIWSWTFLGTTMNSFLNENWQEVIKQLRPSMEKAYSQMLKTIGSQLLERIPYKEMFPDM